MSLSLQFADARHRGAARARRRVARWIRAALAAPAEITVRIVDARRRPALNRDYRGQDHATNVLTFAYATRRRSSPTSCSARRSSSAKPRRRASRLVAHYAHLVVHGTLHAQGFDHERAADAETMEARESAILVGLGFADPYAA